jgi:predicted phosphoribosyltransferase
MKPHVPFADRAEAGRQLGAVLAERGIRDGVVIGLARGGVEVAAAVAAVLGLPLDVLAVRKIGYPQEPEYGIGAVTPDGTVFLRARDGLTDEAVERAIAATVAEAGRLDRRLHGERPAVALRGRTAILVDDGLATGGTMTAAVRWARAAGAEHVIVAVPVAAAASVAEFAPAVDDFVTVVQPDYVAAVGYWYVDFDQVSNERVVALLDRAAHGAGREVPEE